MTALWSSFPALITHEEVKIAVITMISPYIALEEPAAQFASFFVHSWWHSLPPYIWGQPPLRPGIGIYSFRNRGVRCLVPYTLPRRFF